MAEAESSSKATTGLSVGKDYVSAITFSVSTAVAYFANSSSDIGKRKLYTELAPAIGLIVALLLRAIAKKIFYWRGNRAIKNHIAELQAERPSATLARRRVIDGDIAEWNQELKQRIKSNLSK